MAQRRGPPKYLGNWTRVNLVLTEELLEELDQVAYRGKNRSQLIREYIAEGLKREKRRRAAEK